MYMNFNLKSFLTFLSRNKAYTAINVFGLTVSLMFVILIGAYVWQERSVDGQHAKADRILVSCLDWGEGSVIGTHHILQKHLRSLYPDIENSCGVSGMTMRVKKDDGVVSTTALLTDSTFFQLFDFQLLEGDRATCLSAWDNAVVSQTFARKLFGEESPVGKTIVYADSMRLKVTGVVEDLDHTFFKNSPDIITGFKNVSYGGNAFDTDEMFERGSMSVGGSVVFLLMKPGTTFVGREDEISQHLLDGPWKECGLPTLKFTFIPLNEAYSGGYESMNVVVCTADTNLIKVLSGVGVAILLFSVMNYINLTVALSGRRSREMAARRLFGASRWGIVERMMSESLLLCLGSFVLAIILAVAFAPTFGNIIGTQIDMALLTRPSVVAAMVGAWLVLGMVTGAVPALLMSKVQPVEIFRGTLAHRTKMVFSRVFIVVQNVITISLLACAAVMLLQTRHLIDTPMGYDRDGVLVCHTASQTLQDMETFAARLRQQPFVKCVSLSGGTPMDGGNNETMTGDAKGSTYSFQVFVADQWFMDVYGLKLTDGSRPQPGHYYLDGRAIAAIKANPQSFGSPLMFSSYFSGKPSYGGQVEEFDIRTVEEPSHPLVVVIARKMPYAWTISIRLTGDLADGYERVGEIYKEVFHEEMTADDAEFADHVIQQWFEEKVRMSHVVSMFAVLAIIISVLGLVAMSTYFIEQRAKEVALRKVFGSTSNQVRRRLIRSFLVYVAIAFVLAVPVFWWFMGDWMSQFTHRITWWPWLLVAGIAVLLFSYVAVAVQSYVAANENPVKHVKDE